MIKVTTIEGISEGDLVAAPDSDYPVGSIVPGDVYADEDVEWLTVDRVGGYVDFPTVTVHDPIGRTTCTRMQATATIWVRVLTDEVECTACGEPVKVQDAAISLHTRRGGFATYNVTHDTRACKEVVGA